MNRRLFIVAGLVLVVLAAGCTNRTETTTTTQDQQDPPPQGEVNARGTPGFETAAFVMAGAAAALVLTLWRRR